MEGYSRVGGADLAGSGAGEALDRTGCRQGAWGGGEGEGLGGQVDCGEGGVQVEFVISLGWVRCWVYVS